MKQYIIMFLFISLISSVFAIAPNDYFKSGDVADFQEACEINNAPCPTNSECNLTVVAPDTTLAIDNAVMSIQPTYINFTLDNLTQIGEYQYYVACYYPTDSLNGYYQNTFWMNNSGEKDNEYSLIGFSILFIAIIFAYFYTGFNVDEKKFGVKLALFIMGFVNIIGALIASVVSQTSWLSLYQISEVFIWLNVLMIIFMVVHYAIYFLSEQTDSIEKM